MRQLNTAFQAAGKESWVAARTGAREVADPVRTESETLALQRIPRMPRSPRWARMRVGVTRTLVYVAPVKRGVKTRGLGGKRRPNLAPLLMDRAMQPALDHHAADLEQRVDHWLDQMADHFNAGGTPVS
jgi:hypothetical protein